MSLSTIGDRPVKSWTEGEKKRRREREGGGGENEREGYSWVH